jgi:hypothetical protein
MCRLTFKSFLKVFLRKLVTSHWKCTVHRCCSESEFVNDKGAQESIPRNRYVAWLGIDSWALLKGLQIRAQQRVPQGARPRFEPGISTRRANQLGTPGQHYLCNNNIRRTYNFRYQSWNF